MLPFVDFNWFSNGENYKNYNYYNYFYYYQNMVKQYAMHFKQFISNYYELCDII